MKYDPVSTLLSTVNTTLGRTILFGGAVLLGSVIPQAFVWNSWEVAVFGFALNFIAACVGWGWLGWLGFLSIPALIIYFRRFLRDEDSKRDLFIGFSVSFFLFLSLPPEWWQVFLCLSLYVLAGLAYWRLAWVLALVRRRAV
ncbi:hypothetical protein BH09VER1_BH09VER1_43960 [soil metagenome]